MLALGAGLVWADQAIDYKGGDLGTAGEFDLVYDLVGGEARGKSWGLLKPNGRLVTTLPGSGAPEEGAKRRRKALDYMAEPNAEQLRTVAELADEGRLQVMVDRAYPLAEAAAAFRHLEEGHPRGKVVFEVR